MLFYKPPATLSVCTLQPKLVTVYSCNVIDLRNWGCPVILPITVWFYWSNSAENEALKTSCACDGKEPNANYRVQWIFGRLIFISWFLQQLHVLRGSTATKSCTKRLKMDYHDIFVSCRTGDLEKVKYALDHYNLHLLCLYGCNYSTCTSTYTHLLIWHVMYTHTLDTIC